MALTYRPIVIYIDLLLIRHPHTKLHLHAKFQLPVSFFIFEQLHQEKCIVSQLANHHISSFDDTRSSAVVDEQALFIIFTTQFYT